MCNNTQLVRIWSNGLQAIAAIDKDKTIPLNLVLKFNRTIHFGFSNVKKVQHCNTATLNTLYQLRATLQPWITQADLLVDREYAAATTQKLGRAFFPEVDAGKNKFYP